MPASKNLAAYPEIFWEIIRRVAQDKPNGYQLTMPSRAGAIALRGRFNHFRKLIKEVGLEGSMLSEDEFATLQAMQVRLLPRLSRKEEKEKMLWEAKLHFEHVDFLEEFRPLREMRDREGLELHRKLTQNSPELRLDEVKQGNIPKAEKVMDDFLESFLGIPAHPEETKIYALPEREGPTTAPPGVPLNAVPKEIACPLCEGKAGNVGCLMCEGKGVLPE